MIEKKVKKKRAKKVQRPALLKKLISYSKNIVSGKIIACQKHKWACDRFLKDIKKSESGKSPYRFDVEKVQRFLDWVSMFSHTKGVLAGKTIELGIVQLFVVANVYGWINVSTGFRRFTKAYWQVARKNGKSQLLALISLYELMALNPVETMEVYCTATKKDQADIVYNEALQMLSKSTFFKNKGIYEVANKKIIHKKSFSVMRSLSKEDRKKGDGLNPQAATIDEYMAAETSEMYDILDSGMVARTQPLLFIITTAGFELQNPCYRIEYQLISKILNPDVALDMEHYFVMVNELDTDNEGKLLDDINDKTVWEKSNPVVYSYPAGRKFLADRYSEMGESEEKKRNFLTKHMNVWLQLSQMGYMDMALWAACGCGSEGMPDFTNKSCVIGVDISAKKDLTSVDFEFKEDGRYYVFTHSFMPEETVFQKEKTDKVPYRAWAEAGYVSILPGRAVDQRKVKEYVYDKCKEKTWHRTEWALDPWNASQFGLELEEDGETVNEIRQGPKTLCEPTKDFRIQVYTDMVVHDDSPLVSWAMSNAIADVVDRNENILLSKRKSPQRIDPVACIMNSHSRMLAEEVNGGRVLVL
ncbi:MAG: terminase large subunit [Bacteroidetes bacterium]|nr:terminase large subunit [Bacteroidota bacterium]